MRCGLIGRSELRGLGNQSVSVLHGLNPDKVLLVEPQPASWPQHPERYVGHRVTHVYWRRGQLHPEREVRRWFEGLDVAYVAESVYDSRVPFFAAEAGCVIVRHANPEQLSPDEIVPNDPTVWWSATPWRLEHLPLGTRVVPMPTETPPRAVSPDPQSPVRFLHPIGHVAQEDRSGASLVSQAVRRLHAPCQVTVLCQDRRLNIAFRTKGPHVELRVREGGVVDHWDQYRDQDVLVLPRRYGGLSLPNLEAMASGLVLVTTETCPNEIWPGPKVPVRRRWWVQMRCGQVEVCDADPVALADIMARLAGDRDEVAKWQAESLAWAEANSWEALRPLWLEELRRACSSPGQADARTVNAPTPGSVPA